MECPQCHSDNIQRLSVIYRTGTQHINTTSRSYGGFAGSGYGGGSSNTTTTGTAQTALAAQAEPPRKKSYKVTVILGLAGLALAWFYSLPLALLLFSIAAFLGYKAYWWNKNEFPGEYAIWQRSYHCNRCGNFFSLSS